MPRLITRPAVRLLVAASLVLAVGCAGRSGSNGSASGVSVSGSTASATPPPAGSLASTTAPASASSAATKPAPAASPAATKPAAKPAPTPQPATTPVAQPTASKPAPTAAASSAPTFPAATASALPKSPFAPRALAAPSGRTFLDRTKNLPRLGTGSREAAIEAELLAGNVPDFLRHFTAVTLAIPGHTAEVYVLPDYLAIGTDADAVRIPMGAPTAQRIADRLGCLLPTKRLVDAIWQQAATKLAPKPIPPSAQMMSNAYFLQHANLVDAQLAGKKLGLLTAGHKKDVIVSNLIQAKAGRVVIYGWHLLTGSPIQPKTNVHEATYADYSHGVRLVHATMLVDGSPVPVAAVLADPVLSKLLSDEGTIAKPRY